MYPIMGIDLTKWDAEVSTALTASGFLVWRLPTHLNSLGSKRPPLLQKPIVVFKDGGWYLVRFHWPLALALLSAAVQLSSAQFLDVSPESDVISNSINHQLRVRLNIGYQIASLYLILILVIFCGLLMSVVDIWNPLLQMQHVWTLVTVRKTRRPTSHGLSSKKRHCPRSFSTCFFDDFSVSDRRPESSLSTLFSLYLAEPPRKARCSRGLNMNPWPNDARLRLERFRRHSVEFTFFLPRPLPKETEHLPRFRHIFSSSNIGQKTLEHLTTTIINISGDTSAYRIPYTYISLFFLILKSNMICFHFISSKSSLIWSDLLTRSADASASQQIQMKIGGIQCPSCPPSVNPLLCSSFVAFLLWKAHLLFIQ